MSGTGLLSGTERFVDTWNYNPAGTEWLDVCAPGWDILTTDIGGDYLSVPGTSFSSPLVASLCGLILSINPNLTPAQIRSVITATADKIDSDRFPYNGNGWNSRLGYGRINAYKALKYTLEHYGGTVVQSFTIPAGETWNFVPSVTVKFANWKGMTVNGILNAYGTSSQRITFTCISPSPGWSGVYFGSGGRGYFDYATVSSVNSYGGAAISSNNANYLQITNSTIENNTGVSNGVSITYNSSAYLAYNTIRNNSRHGVYIYQSSPTLLRNTITATSSSGNAAVALGYFAHPVMGDLYNQTESRNTLTSGYYGLYASYYCNPLLGSSSAWSFKNRLLGNAYANAYAEMNCNVYAQYDWWGQSPPDATKIIATAGSVIYYNPWLTSDPNQQPLVTPLPIQSPISGEPRPVSESTSSNDLLKGRELRLQNQYTAAIESYKGIISADEASRDASSAIVELGAVFKETKDGELLSYIESLTTQSELLRPVALEVLSDCLSYSGDFARVTHVNNLLVSGYAGTIHEKNSRLNEFFNLYNSGKIDLAREQLSTVISKFPIDDDIRSGLWFMNIAGKPISIGSEQEVSQSNQEEASAFDLANYPNPFNPSTEIVFTVPQDGVVRLRVFDVLGREIMNLVNEFMLSGRHSVSFNASALPSGVYFYRLDQNGKSIVRKMQLLR